MEIINVERKAFEAMVKRIEELTQKVETMYRNSSKEKIQWLDGQDVCSMLRISPRTLQTYRDKGILSYSQINHKIFYKILDIEKILKTANYREIILVQF